MMNMTQLIPVSVEPEAAALVSELGLKAELDRMLAHARETITGLRELHVKFAPAYDTGEERVVIEALRDSASRGDPSWSRARYNRWKSATFSPDVHRHFTLLDEYGNDGG